jgi:hypothetical protein
MRPPTAAERVDVDPSTQDERAWQLAPTLHVSLIGRDFTVWVNPVTGTSCRLDASGDYEVSRMIRTVRKPTVLGQILASQAEQMLGDPHAETTLRAVAHAIVAVDATA